MGFKDQLKKHAPGLQILSRSARRYFQTFSEIHECMGRSYAAPAPWIIKRAVIRRNALPGGTFVETGTYMGDTAAYAAKFSAKVITLEPFHRLYCEAHNRFRHSPSVELINAASEAAFPALLPGLSGHVTFWLDAHYSGEGTFIGQHISPIEIELAAIGEQIGRYAKCVVMVDDMRGFGLSPGYPVPEAVVQWAVTNDLDWHIEHDILVMTKRV